MAIADYDRFFAKEGIDGEREGEKGSYITDSTNEPESSSGFPQEERERDGCLVIKRVPKSIVEIKRQFD